jgi:hypothetical protein
MAIGDKRTLVRRRWLALLSLMWIAAVYALWMFFNSPGAFDRAHDHCGSLGPYPYAYAECLQFAAQTSNDRYTDVATMATLVAIVPVALLWAAWLAARLLRECRSIECTKRAA